MDFEIARLDDYATRITMGLAYLGGLLMLPILFAYLANLRWGGLLIPTALALPLALYLLLCYAGQPRMYRIEGERLLIKRRLWRAMRVPLKDISGVSPAGELADVPQRGLRFAFNPGIFGYQGPYRLVPYGMVFFLATNRARLVSIARPGLPPLVISPNNPRDFITALNDKRAKAAMQELETEVGSQEPRVGSQESGVGSRR